MHLPAPIRTYFTAEAPRDGAAFAAAFAPDAIVHDEGHIHRGPEEIRLWWQAAKAKYRHRAEPLDLTRDRRQDPGPRPGQRRFPRQPRDPDLPLRTGG